MIEQLILPGKFVQALTGLNNGQVVGHYDAYAIKITVANTCASSRGKT